MGKCGTSSTRLDSEEKTDKVIVSFYDEKICGVRIKTHPRRWFEFPTDIDSSATLFHYSKRETVLVANTFDSPYDTTIIMITR